jgi:hypothetical protein
MYLLDRFGKYTDKCLIYKSLLKRLEMYLVFRN